MYMAPYTQPFMLFDGLPKTCQIASPPLVQLIGNQFSLYQMSMLIPMGDNNIYFLWATSIGHFMLATGTFACSWPQVRHIPMVKWLLPVCGQVIVACRWPSDYTLSVANRLSLLRVQTVAVKPMGYTKLCELKMTG